MWHQVAEDADVAPGRIRAVTVGRRQYVVCRTFEGELRAMRAICPHRGAPLQAGKLCSMVTSQEFGSYELDKEHTLLRCPWHGIEFDLETGRAPADPKLAAQTYPVKSENGKILLDV